MTEVYVAIARYGGTLDDVQVFESMPIAVARVRQWVAEMEPQFDVNDAEVDVLGEYLCDGETWYFDVLPCPVRTAQGETISLLAELTGAGFVPEGFASMARALVAEYEATP